MHNGLISITSYWVRNRYSLCGKWLTESSAIGSKILLMRLASDFEPNSETLEIGTESIDLYSLLTTKCSFIIGALSQYIFQVVTPTNHSKLSLYKIFIRI